MRTNAILGPLTVCLASLSCGVAAADVLPPHSIVDGKPIGEYTADWWRWALGFSSPGDPFTDPTGADANLNQSGPVFFLAGTAGSEATRTFNVPAGKFLLVPLLVVELSQLELGDFSLTEAQVRAEVNAIVDQVDSLHASIDGVEVPNLFDHREQSPAFSYSAAAGNPFGVPTGDSGIAVAGGYWLMLSPLEVGETHVLSFGGGISSFNFSVSVTSTITAVPEPASLILSTVGLGAIWLMSRPSRTGRSRSPSHRPPAALAA
ncbi:hypothetical protein EP7_000010 [Isosphaeraceae bacterium EP7]